ncbi:MAG TPA: TetR/AcrR family transcriptional regulator [Gaiellaceae bacterium]
MIKERIATAAFETLRTEGFAGATSRAIARQGGFNQALVFYHYGSLEALLLAALQRSSEERLARYRERVESVAEIPELLAVLAELHAEDEASGHMRVMSQLVAGSLNRPELGRGLLALMEPWVDLARETLERVLPTGLPSADLAYAIVVFYFGLNLISHLDPEDRRPDALLERARELAPFLEGLSASAESPGRPSTSPGPASAT